MLRHASASLFRRTSVSQSSRNLARRRRGVPGVKSAVATVPPPPTEDPWEEVKDEKTGQVYYWNTQTNETTALGAPKPTSSNNAVAQAQQPQQQGGGFMSTMAEGFAFGAGASLARQAVGSLFGGFGGGGGYGDDGGGSMVDSSSPMDQQQSDESNYEWGGGSWGGGGDDSGDGDDWT